ncbi:MAG: alkylmercury lyase MerB [Thermodesulfobacteriota bacterium]
MKEEKLDMQELISSFPDEFLKLNLKEQRLSTQLYRFLAEGQPVSTERLANDLNLSSNDVTNILNKWPGVYYNQDNYIIGYWGLALPKMSHRFAINGHTLYTWCAWDSLFIPEIINKTAHVESTCPVTGKKIQLTVTPDGIEELNPAIAVMSFVTPESSKVRENVISSFCHYIHFFISAEAGSKWKSNNEGTFILSIDEAYYLGRKKNEAQYKDVFGTKSESGIA